MVKVKNSYHALGLCKGAFATFLFFTSLLCSTHVAMAVCVNTITATTPTVDFVDHGDGTVTHTKTGLMWKKCTEGLSGAACATGAATLYSWSGAMQAAQTLNNAGGFALYTDWRVPNIKELQSLVEEQCATPSINSTVFPGTVIGWHYSSSGYVGAATSVWHLDFNFGGNGAVNKATVSDYVRLVRGGL